MGKLIPFRRRNKWRHKGPQKIRFGGPYRTKAIFGRRRWYQRMPWRPVLLGVFLLAMWPLSMNGGLAHWSFLPWVAQPTAQDPEAAWFLRCSGPSASRYTCVVDGDTIYYQGQMIRLLGIDTPELFSAQCAAEARLAEQATQMLTDVLNAGPFTIEERFLSESEDRYGRLLRRITREGAPIGQELIHAGLARRYGGGGRDGWCG